MNRDGELAAGGRPRLAVAFGAAALVAACVAVYAQTARFGWVNWDDHAELLTNRALTGGLGLSALRWALSPHGLFRPIPWLSHALDFTLFGLDPRGPHLVNLGLHAFVTVLLFGLLARATGRRGPAFLTAALWALHPLRAESVAWVTGRKDILALGLSLGAIAAHAAFAARPTPARRVAAAGAFLLAVLAKPVTVVLPVALLAIDFWPLGRMGPIPWRRLVSEKAPLLLIAALASIPTFVTQLQGGAVRPVGEVTVALRLTNAADGLLWYVTSVFWPRDLAFFYPLLPRPAAAPVLGALLFFGAVTLGAFSLRRQAPALLAGWAFFVVTLLPTIGLLQTGGQRAADRYSYIPAIGLTAGVVFGLDSLLRARRVPPSVARLAGASGAVLAAGFAVSAHAQAATWRDDVSLFTNAVEATQGNWLAHHLLALTLSRQGDHEGAVRHATATLDIAPGWEPGLFFLSELYARLGRSRDLLPHLFRGIAANPGSAALYRLSGDTFAATGAPDRARVLYERALSLDPKDERSRAGLAELAGRAPARPR